MTRAIECNRRPLGVWSDSLAKIVAVLALGSIVLVSAAGIDSDASIYAAGALTRSAAPIDPIQTRHNS